MRRRGTARAIAGFSPVVGLGAARTETSGRGRVGVAASLVAHACLGGAMFVCASRRPAGLAIDAGDSVSFELLAASPRVVRPGPAREPETAHIAPGPSARAPTERGAGARAARSVDRPSDRPAEGATSQPVHEPPGDDGVFLMGRPRAGVRAPRAPSELALGARAVEGLRTSSLPEGDAGDGAGVGEAARRRGARGPRSQGELDARAREQSEGYVRGLLAQSARDTHVSGGGAYFFRAMRRVRQHWTPAGLRDRGVLANLGRGLRGMFNASPERVQEIEEAARGPLAHGPGAAAAAEIDAAHPHSRLPGQQVTLGAASLASREDVTVEVDVDQDAEGRVTTLRVAHSSGVPEFDAAAVRAIREAQEGFPAAPRGFARGVRSRWQFVSRTTYTPPGVPIANPDGQLRAVGLASVDLDPEPGEERAVRYPGSAHRRNFLRVVRSAPLP